MIRRYTFGKPFPTEAVVKELPYETDALPFFSIEDNRLSLPLENDIPVYGLEIGRAHV